MAYHYHLRVWNSDHIDEYSTFAEASQAIATSVGDDDQPWELIRTSDGPDAWTDVLYGAGPHPAPTRSALRHYPPSH